MAENPGTTAMPGTNAPPPRRDGWLTLLYGLLLLGGLALLAVGVIRLARDQDILILAIGILAVIVPAALYPIASALAGQGDTIDDADPVITQLKEINNRLLISDSAKRIAYRQRDQEALRRAIREDIDQRDFSAALVLVDEMANTYGLVEESEKYREEIREARAQEVEKQLEAEAARLRDMVDKHDFEKAYHTAKKFQRIYPDNPLANELPKRVLQAREQYKQNLEREFLKAAERDDVNRAMILLKEMDKYLSPEEGEHFAETAKGVIGKARENLGVRFKLAVQDKEWLHAVKTGEQIIRDFPNTQMAQEVRDRLDLLRERAAGQQAARAQETV